MGMNTTDTDGIGCISRPHVVCVFTAAAVTAGFRKLEYIFPTLLADF